jgi:hypothetical protein
MRFMWHNHLILLMPRVGPLPFTNTLQEPLAFRLLKNAATRKTYNMWVQIIYMGH